MKYSEGENSATQGAAKRRREASTWPRPSEKTSRRRAHLSRDGRDEMETAGRSVLLAIFNTLVPRAMGLVKVKPPLKVRPVSSRRQYLPEARKVPVFLHSQHKQAHTRQHSTPYLHREKKPLLFL